MSYDEDERAVLARFSDKTGIAGGAKAGYMLRRDSIAYGRAAGSLDGALSTLVEKGVLKSSEDGVRFYLTADGAERLAEL